ncbi:Two-component response regulator ARR2 [Carex littledalei]|uniref:Two-component response regulator ARR2 n=1 Tax=Carex littledalei TaxID=544730 RepID=A0A833RAX0_9POAL|nr:Two-component response regulator ARR2 [Carex littledalei]
MVKVENDSDISFEEGFPAGIKVLVIDDDRVSLQVVCTMLERCGYKATKCTSGTKALEMLRENEGEFDIVLTDVHMPDMDGFQLLELVGLEMDIPVVIVSSDSSRETIMKAIQSGACDYLIKPIQKKEVEIIWKHVIRRKNSISGDPESFGILEKNNNESLPRKNDDESGIALRARKKRREPTGEDDEELENGEESKKKERFNWNGERHKQFVAAVNQLGINNAVPKKILNALNIPGLKREHVASHLQKYRLGLKKAEKDKQAQHVNSPFGSSLNPIMGPTSIFSFQNLPPRPVTWNNHAPNIISPLHTMPQVGSSMNAPGFLADSHDMLWQVVVSQQLPVCQTSMNPLLSNNLMGNGSGTSQPPSLGSNNGGFNNNNYNGSVGSGFVQNSYSQALVGQDRNQSPSSNLTCGNSEAIVNPNSWDLDKRM